MKHFLLIAAVLVGLPASTLAQTRALPPGEIRANGDITFGNALKLGKREGGKTTLQPDDVESRNGIAAGVCDTSQWTAGYEPGYSSPLPDCFATKQSSKIDLKFPAVIGIGPENPGVDPHLSPNDQTFIQWAQHLIQAKTTEGDMRQESGLVVNMDVRTGKGRQTNHGQKVGIYIPTIARAGAGNTWALNPALQINAGVGAQSMYVNEQDLTNFNGPYQPSGSLGNAVQIFRTHLGFPVTSSELWSGHTPPPSTLTITTTAGSPNVTFSGTLHAADKLTAAGLPANTFVNTVNGGDAKVNQVSGTAVLNQPATASGTNVTATRTTYNMFNGHLYQGAELIRDNTFFDATGSVVSLNIAGTHHVGVNTTLGVMPYAMLAGAGQRICLNALAGCVVYDAGNGLLNVNDGKLLVTNNGIITAGIQAPGTTTLDLGNSRGASLRVLDAGGPLTNYVTLQGSSLGSAPAIKAAGSDANVPLRLAGQGTSPVQVLGEFGVTGSAAIGQGLTVNGSLIQSTKSTPSSSSSACVTGQQTWDADYEYRCVATNTWKRSALTSW